MGIKQDVEENLKGFPITKIDGQPTNKDLNQLKTELFEMVASIRTSNNGGSHGHIGMIMDETVYQAFSKGGAAFIMPTYPGPYPSTVDPDAVIHERQVAEYKEKIREFETYLSVENALCLKIKEAVDPEWLEAIRGPMLGFTHRIPMAMLEHL